MKNYYRAYTIDKIHKKEFDAKFILELKTRVKKLSCYRQCDALHQRVLNSLIASNNYYQGDSTGYLPSI